MNKKFLISATIIGLLIVLCDAFLNIGKGPSLLFTLVYWISIIEGCIALVAVCETAEGTWIKPIKSYLLSLYPLILFCSLLFIFMFTKMDYYPWTKHPGMWLNSNFFLIRNVVFLFIVFLVARKYAQESLSESPKKIKWAIMYLFLYVISLSLVAFDWVMSLEYPWVSTLFGAYFFVQGLFTALAISGIILYLLYRRSPAEFIVYKKLQHDISTFMCGFALLCTGFFFAQYLVIWYGHIPEESSFFINRLSHHPIRELMMLIIPMLFVVPFGSMMFKCLKKNACFVFLVSLNILIGLFIERWVIIGHLVPLNFFLIAIEFFGFGILFFLLMKSRQIYEKKE